MRKLYETAVILFAAIGWWGFVYPDMCLTEDVYEQEYEEEQTQEQEQVQVQTIRLERKQPKTVPHKEEKPEGQELGEQGWKIGNICIKSRIVEYIYQER